MNKNFLSITLISVLHLFCLGLYQLLLLKDTYQVHYLMVVPIFYVLAALSQGSLVSGMLGLCLIPFGYRMNKYLMSIQTARTKFQ